MNKRIFLRFFKNKNEVYEYFGYNSTITTKIKVVEKANFFWDKINQILIQITNFDANTFLINFNEDINIILGGNFSASFV